MQYLSKIYCLQHSSQGADRVTASVTVLCSVRFFAVRFKKIPRNKVLQYDTLENATFPCLFGRMCLNLQKQQQFSLDNLPRELLESI